MTRDMTKGARFSYYLMLFMAGCMFWLATKTGHFSMYAPIYGWVADYPAEWWAGAMLFPSALYLMALFINGRRWWTAPMRCAVGISIMLYFSSFVSSALPAVGGDLVVIFSAVLGFKASVMLCFDVADLSRKRHERK